VLEWLARSMVEPFPVREAGVVRVRGIDLSEPPTPLVCVKLIQRYRTISNLK
jgi:hypothetical protein